MPFIDLMRRANLLLTDIGWRPGRRTVTGQTGAGNEETTERPEAIEAGVARLVGMDEARIVLETKNF